MKLFFIASLLISTAICCPSSLIGVAMGQVLNSLTANQHKGIQVEVYGEKMKEKPEEIDRRPNGSDIQRS
jgi:hypothetical protein